ncbi:uncharacterized protein PAC_00322 [Phialocephala subalpina]|uniref:Mid2 domain-containing protein n=1 Tax=Phialocephala subalpina TaxID=576137 RepID=A0A1L7WCF5_9HELO|nr:uncharacterized protein PAC_00322 [Phialocephala subalpina]
MSNSSVCFFPDGQSNGASSSPQFVPCNPSAAQSVCCAVGETGGCTDRTYRDGTCPTLCTDSTGRNAGAQNSWTFLKACDALTGNLQWVCSLLGDCTDSSVRFNLLVGGPQEFNITGDRSISSSTSISSSSISTTKTVSIVSATSIPSSSPSALNTNQCPTTTGSSTNIVGAAVGIPLGLLLLLAIAWAFWERRRKIVPLQDYNTLSAMENKATMPYASEAPA